jgi:hypothetical protein
MGKITHEDEDIDHLIAGIEKFTRTTKTVYSNGFVEVISAVGIALILIPITCFIFVISMKILREIDPPAKVPIQCSLSLTTRYAIELGRLSNG